jgi:hypothetical protein
LALVTTEGDEVELVGLLEAFQARWHGSASSLHPTLRKRREGWGTRGFWVVVGRRDLGGAGGLHPTLRKRHEGWGTRDFLGGCGKARTWWCGRFTSHPSQRREGWGTPSFGVGSGRMLLVV